MAARAAGTSAWPKGWADDSHPLPSFKGPLPCLYDGRLLTLEDTVEFFNLVQGLKLSDQEKKDLVAFLRAL